MSMAEFDIIIFGATGFTGSQAAHYLDQHAPTDLSWAIAGRNEAKLNKLATELNAAPPIVVADALDREAVFAMVERTRVLCTTAGPYARYGDNIVDACAEKGVHYCDITGETPWVRDVIDRCHQKAVESGALIVPFCGFDSIPSDIGAFFVVQQIRERFDQPTRSVKAFFQAGGGGLNGGTLASMLNLFEQHEMERVRDPVLLNPREDQSLASRVRQQDQTAAVYDADVGRWTAPFFMAPINTRVVRRSATLAEADGNEWGPDFTYHEAMLSPRKFGQAIGMGISASMAVFEKAAQYQVVRDLLDRIGPDPGDGPDEVAMDRGWVKVTYVGTAADGRKLKAVLSADGDPGNRFTVRVLCESALCLLQDDLPAEGGVLTPATAMGDALVERLQAAEVRLEVSE